MLPLYSEYQMLKTEIMTTGEKSFKTFAEGFTLHILNILKY